MISNCVFCLIYSFICSDGLSNPDLSIFDITISSSPIVLPKLQNDHMLMYSKYGQHFVCEIPNIKKISSVQNNFSLHTDSNVSMILYTYSNLPCLYYNVGQLIYELCIGKSVTQSYNSKITHLGVFSNDFNWTTANDNDDQVKYHYHSQYYNNGSLCDLTELPRSVEVQYYCVRKSAYIIDVSEPESCTYVLHVGLPELCFIDVFNMNTVHPILCSPSVSDSDFSKYIRINKVKENRKELLRKKNSYLQLQSKLSLLREQRVNKYLNTRRSYRLRRLISNIKDARLCSRHILSFLRLVEVNFDTLKFLSAKELHSIPSFTVLQNVSSIADNEYMRKESNDFDEIFVTIKRSLKVQLPLKNKRNTGDTENTFMEELDNKQMNLAISIKILTIIRKAVERFEESAIIPRILHMVYGFENVIRKVNSISDLTSLVRIKRTVNTYTPRNNYLSVSNLGEKIIFHRNSSTDVLKDKLTSLNRTLLFYKNSLLLISIDLQLKRLIKQYLPNVSQQITEKYEYYDENQLSLALSHAHLDDIAEDIFTKMDTQELKTLLTNLAKNNMHIFKLEVHLTKQGLVYIIKVSDKDSIYDMFNVNKSLYDANKANYEFRFGAY